MFDDFGGFLKGEGPYVKVFDPDLNPNHILDKTLTNRIQVRWGFSGPGKAMLPSLRFTVTVYAQPIAPPGPAVPLTVSLVPSSPSAPLSVDIPIPSTLAVGVYHLTTVISTTNAGTNGYVPIAGFHEGPAIELRNP